ncbi:MAG: hypothetical protein HZB25_12665 [Candidatus Eisenbacteria bacterium]|nr:hypothetical protein [Candidatus Eisenbacteria bacterium]
MDSTTIATVAAGLENAAHGRLETSSLRIYVKAPRATPEGITFESLEDPVPTDALRLPMTVPWTDVQTLETSRPARIPLALGLGVVGAIVGHMLWTGSSRSIVVEGHPIHLEDRQAYYIVGGIEAGMVTGFALNLWSPRVRRVYPPAGD